LALGGRTVQELQAAMSTSELASWQAYVEDNGPLDYQRRYDEPAALIAWAARSVAPGIGNSSPKDFYRYHKKSGQTDIDSAIAKLFGVNV
jgi:hypothetical protein